jgi:hypothetical protein
MVVQRTTAREQVTARHPIHADMAQLVERTLGKGEVLSSILSISTIIPNPGEHKLSGVLLYMAIRKRECGSALARIFLRY